MYSRHSYVKFFVRVALVVSLLVHTGVVHAVSVTLVGDRLLLVGTSSWTVPDEVEIVLDGSDLVVKPLGSPIATGRRFPLADVASIGVRLDAGNDILYAPGITVPMTVHGGEGDDTIWTGDADDIVYGEWGMDVVRAGDGNDTVHGFLNVRYSDITTTFDDEDILHGGPGLDTIIGGPDKDFIYADEGGSGSGFEMLYGFYPDTPDDYDVPFDGNDELSGSDSKNKIWGGPGDDLIVGGDSYDWLFGQTGDDTIEGLRFHDRIWGHRGMDTISGGSGPDEMYGGDDDDVITGGMGDDLISGGGGNDVLRGGNGDDVISGDEENDEIFGGAGHDRVDGGPGDDVISVAGGDDTVQGGSGNDEIDLGYGDDYADGGGDNDVITGHYGDDEILGGPGNDILSGDRDDDYLDGGAGRDTLTGGPGQDVLIGGVEDDLDGDDSLSGGFGSDVLYGGPGDDALRGGEGADLLVSVDGLPDDTLLGGGGFDSFWGDEFNIVPGFELRDAISDASAAEQETNEHYVVDFANGADFTWDGDAIDDPDATGATDATGADLFDHYESFADLPLFPADGPALVDIAQGLKGDCWLLAALGATAGVSENALRQTVIPLPDGTFIVELGSSFLSSLLGTAVQHYRVDADLPICVDGNDEFLCYAGVGTDYSTEFSLWVAIIEKAVALDRFGFTALWRADTYDDSTFGLAGEAFRDIGAEGRTTGEVLSDLGGGVVQAAADYLDAGRAVAVCTGNSPVGLPTAWHWYVVLEVTFDAAGEPDTVLLYNPHGVDDSEDEDGLITWGDPDDGFLEVSAEDVEDSVVSGTLVGLSAADFWIFDE